MKKKIYIDFDSTLFDTDTFYNNFLKLCLEYGVDKKVVKEIRCEIFKDNSEFNLDILGKEIYSRYKLPYLFISRLEELYSGKYLYIDAIDFLEKIHLKYDLILLTYGNKYYQYKKIVKTNIIKYFKDIIITNDSKANLNVDFINSVFIDNNPNEILGFYNKGARHLIRIRKENDNYSTIDLKLKEVFEINNFNDILSNDLLDKVMNYE